MSRGKLVLEKVNDFQLDHVFDCGQCFRWNKEEDGSYTGIACGKVLNVSKKGTDLILNNTDADEFLEFWREYFDFDTDYTKIKDDLIKKDSVMAEAIQAGQGIRILNQDVWETVISFIISANNNIPRIKKCIESLCERYGEHVCRYKGKDYYSFPEPEVLANLTLDDLVPCRLGYRAKYIVATAKAFVANGKSYYEALKEPSVPASVAFERITQLAGVGPKVANCIMLFALKKRSAFPIDTWMKKVMNHLYDFNENDVKSMEQFAADTYGDVAGIAQQYLFYYMRNYIFDDEE